MNVIPERFELAGETWQVRYVDEEGMRKADEHWEDSWGLCNRVERVIYIHKDAKDSHVNIFMHELAHAILCTMGYLGVHNEQQIQGVVNLVHQYLKTARGKVSP